MVWCLEIDLISGCFFFRCLICNFRGYPLFLCVCVGFGLEIRFLSWMFFVFFCGFSVMRKRFWNFIVGVVCSVFVS